MFGIYNMKHRHYRLTLERYFDYGTDLLEDGPGHAARPARVAREQTECLLPAPSSPTKAARPLAPLLALRRSILSSHAWSNEADEAGLEASADSEAYRLERQLSMSASIRSYSGRHV